MLGHTRISRILMTLAAMAFSIVAGATHQDNTDTGVEAIWRVQSVRFEYRSSDVFYNCDSLQRKIRAILLAVGAHQSVIIKAGCMPSSAVDSMSAQIALATPVPATEENIRAATAVDSRRELVARLNGAPLPTANDIQRFPAKWRTVSLTRTGGVWLQPSDCDLLRHLNEQVFPKIAVQRTRGRLTCGPFIGSIKPTLEVMALVPVSADELTSARTM
jgi:hypothetical protein